MGVFGNSLNEDNHDSPIGAIGGKVDRVLNPLSWITGGKLTDFTSNTLPRAVNSALSHITTPLNDVDREIDPLQRIPMFHNLATGVTNKPGDALVGVAGGLFAAPAIGGALGAGAGTAGTAGAADAGGTAGVGGLTGLFSGPAAYGDAGLTGTVSADGSGLGGAMGGDLGGALGSSPTGLFSGLLPGGGMTGTASGALGGGLSGEAAGASSIGGASMGGLNTGSLMNLAQQFMQNQSNQSKQQANQYASQSGVNFQPLQSIANNALQRQQDMANTQALQTNLQRDQIRQQALAQALNGANYA